MPESGPDLLLILCLGLGVAGVLHGLLLLLWTYENTRVFRSRLRTAVSRDFTPRVQLFMPCKGVENSFVETVNGILALDYPRFGVTFIVESANDPAYEVLRHLLDRSSGPCTRLLVAGLASDCGQKVHNLLTATAELADDVQVLAFADSDIVPDRDWLRRLVRPLQGQATGVVTGYRWFLARAGDWAGLVLSALNASVAASLGNHPRNNVWGGSWAIRRSTFDALRQAELCAGPSRRICKSPRWCGRWDYGWPTSPAAWSPRRCVGRGVAWSSSPAGNTSSHACTHRRSGGSPCWG